MGDSEEERRSDVSSLLTQIDNLARSAEMATRIAHERPFDAIYLLEKLSSAERSAAHAIRDLTLVLKPGDSDRAVSVSAEPPQ